MNSKVLGLLVLASALTLCIAQGTEEAENQPSFAELQDSWRSQLNKAKEMLQAKSKQMSQTIQKKWEEAKENPKFKEMSATYGPKVKEGMDKIKKQFGSWAQKFSGYMNKKKAQAAE